jgi:preprotein translocase SecE subunit
MARDRQRAKRRRAERRAGDDGIDSPLGEETAASDDAIDSPLGEGTGAPDPWQDSSADVSEARLAEAGALPPDDDMGGGLGEIYPDELTDDDERERAPDAVEGDAVSARDRAAEHHPRRKRGRLITFLGHCVDELRRVQWPNRRHVGQATAVVLGFVVVAGGYLGLLDALWQPLIEAIL